MRDEKCPRGQQRLHCLREVVADWHDDRAFCGHAPQQQEVRCITTHVGLPPDINRTTSSPCIHMYTLTHCLAGIKARYSPGVRDLATAGHPAREL